MKPTYTVGTTDLEPGRGVCQLGVGLTALGYQYLGS